MNKNSNHSKKKIVITVTVTVVLIAAVFFGIFVIQNAGASDKIYDGVYVGDIHLGSMTEAEARSVLSAKFGTFEYNPVLTCNGIYINVQSSRIELKPNIDKTVKAALSYGKKGSLSDKIKAKKKLKSNPCHIELIFDCNLERLQYELNEKLSDYITDVQSYSVEIEPDCLVVTNGKPGRGVDASEVVPLISKAYVQGNLDKAIEIEITDIYPEKINADEFCEEYNRAPKDAECIQEDGSITITPEVIGVEIDNDKAKKILEENKDSTSSYKIPAKITYPAVTAAELEAEYTDTLIGTYSSNYETSSANRKENIRLASEKINGRILNPGEVFSFNDVVGPRTEATGFKVAHVYSGNKVVDGVGGGICQVSSTLYNAVVFADLEIVYRTNHSIPVSYVPLGRDATVSYGTIDFKFKNNKETPVKLEVIADGNRLTVNVYGRKKYKKDISIETAVTGTIAYSTSTIKDDTMYEGERKIEEKGSNGTTTEAYKIIKENGTVVSRELLCKSSYSSITQVERVGTKKREADKPQENTTPESGSNTPDTPAPEAQSPYGQNTTPQPGTDLPQAQVSDEYNEFEPVYGNGTAAENAVSSY